MSRSLLDRLLDDGSGSHGTPLRELDAAIRRDLEALLKARRPWAPLPERFGGLNNSILGYGLPDFAAGSFNSPAQREALCKEVAAAIRRFEPRLGRVSVKLRDRADAMEPVLSLQIEAVLLDGGEPVRFETKLDTTTADMVVRPHSHA